MSHVIGVDIGGTNTDGVLLNKHEVIYTVKKPTTDNIKDCLSTVLRDIIDNNSFLFTQSSPSSTAAGISRVNIGTTHFVNAILQQKQLQQVCLIRLCGPSTRSVPPFATLPSGLRSLIEGPSYLGNGGYQFNGDSIIEFDKESLTKFVACCLKEGYRYFVISGVFSPVQPKQEIFVRDEIIKQMCPEASVTVSHEIASLGFLERENAALLNECLKPLASALVKSIEKVMKSLRWRSSADDHDDSYPPQQPTVYLTQNDGCVLPLQDCCTFPLFTFSSGVTNSMRGASFLSGQKHAIVLDIGGTSTDAGLLIDGFPKPASARVKIAGVETHFSIPDVISIALGGGSVINHGHSNQISIGPTSVACELTKKSLVFGGSVFTTTDFSVLRHQVKDIGHVDRWKLEKYLINHFIGKESAEESEESKEEEEVNNLLEKINQEIMNKIRELVIKVKVSSEVLPIVLVGGGTVLISNSIKELTLDEEDSLPHPVFIPPHAAVANALGAALAELSLVKDLVIHQGDYEMLLAQTEFQLKSQLISRGCRPESCRILNIQQISLPYMPGSNLRLIVKCCGEIDEDLQKNILEIHKEKNPFNLLPFQPRRENLFLWKKKVDDDDGDYLPNYSHFKPCQFSLGLGKAVSCEDVEDIAIGAGLLGTGGGGNPSLGKTILLELMKQTNKVPRIVSIDQLLTSVIQLSSTVANPRVLFLAFMGSPVVLTEKLPSMLESLALIRAAGIVNHLPLNRFIDSNEIEEIKKKILLNEENEEENIVALACCEIGGMNSMEPLIAGLLSGLAVIDADGMGRAFPELQMFYPFIRGHEITPCLLANEFGQVFVMDGRSIQTPLDLEREMRKLTIQCGCSAAVSFPSVSVSKLQELLIPHAYSRCLSIGRAIRQTRQQKQSITQMLTMLLNARHVADGRIVLVKHEIQGGWSRGFFDIQTFPPNAIRLRIDVQNEYLSLRQLLADEEKEENQCELKEINNKASYIATVPDLVCIMDLDSGQPIMTDELRYGLRVSVLVVPCATQLREPESMKFVSPKAFGYDHVEFKPCGDFKHTPICF